MRKLVGDCDDDERRAAIAEVVGGTIKDVEEMEVRLGYPPDSLDRPVSRHVGGGIFLRDMLPSDLPDGEQLMEADETRKERKHQLWRALKELGERERRIVISRHLSDSRRTLRELGNEMDISKERVRQLEERALKTLRESISARCDVQEML